VSGAVEIEAASPASLSEDVVESIGRLVSQLSSSAPPPSAGELGEIAGSTGSVLFLARLGEDVVGMLTLVTYRIPTGVRAVIEDVVVDETRRGAGIGAALVSAALAESDRRGARHVDLTSRPSREAANRMYVRMGFTERETNVYRYVGGP
jgi:ribosomal protein S18 acetylase RimI-like enzyme